MFIQRKKEEIQARSRESKPNIQSEEQNKEIHRFRPAQDDKDRNVKVHIYKLPCFVFEV